MLSRETGHDKRVQDQLVEADAADRSYVPVSVGSRKALEHENDRKPWTVEDARRCNIFKMRIWKKGNRRGQRVTDAFSLQSRLCTTTRRVRILHALH